MGRGVAGVALVAALVLVPFTWAGAGSAPQGDSRRWSGRQAVTRLGDRVPAVAARHDMSPSELRRHLIDDPALFVDSTDALLYVEEVVAQQEQSPTPPDGTIADADAFRLHSKPGSNRVIHLDFDGHLLSRTAWNNSTGGDCYADPFDTDQSPTTFNSSELAVIKSVWRQVAEDFAPFDVDVTTEDPGFEAINRTDASDQRYGTRALITRSVSPCPNGKTLYQSVCSAGCGGVAYVGVFDDYGTGGRHAFYQPALVFQNGTGSRAKSIAEAASHEVGHNVGLRHDGTTTGCGSDGLSACGYYAGHGSWAPIMGVGYQAAITQWSRGEYAGANNTQDDYLVAASNGLFTRSDDHGDTAAAATTLSGPSLSAEGVISSPSDVDAFTIAAGAGMLNVTVSPAPISPNLDVRLELRSADGVLVAADDPVSGSTSSDTATGMAAAVSVRVPAGVYTVFVDGVGSGDPLTTGYSDWGSLGYYRLSGSVDTSPKPPPVAALTVTPSVTAPLAVTLDASASFDPEGADLTYDWSMGDGTTKAAAEEVVTHTYTTPGSYTATVTVTDTLGLSVSRSATVNVTSRIDVASRAVSGARISASSVTGTADVTVRTADGAAAGSVTVTGSWYLGTTLLSSRTATTNTAGMARISSGSVTASPGQRLRFCVTKLARSGSVADPTLFAPTTATDCANWTVVK
jgi:hypothetical protein